MKIALLIGINYVGTRNELQGCINDAANMYEYLLTQGFQRENMTMMTDVAEGINVPTRANILAQLDRLAAIAKPEDEVFVHYSGHGTQSFDFEREESDLYDEVWCPIDFDRAGGIKDDELKAHLVNKTKSTIIVISDCCHSGTMLDLRYNYIQTLLNTMITQQEPKYASTENRVICISGCQDFQTSADAWEHNSQTNQYQSQGALTANLLKVLRENPGQLSYKSLMKKLLAALKTRGYSQIPRLTSGNYINLADKFVI